MKERLGRSFLTIVRAVDSLRSLVADDPYRGFRLPSGAKRIVTFLRKNPASTVRLPIEVDGGVTRTNAGELVAAGAEILVAGTAIYGADDPAAAIGKLRDAAVATVQA